MLFYTGGLGQGCLHCLRCRACGWRQGVPPPLARGGMSIHARRHMRAHPPPSHPLRRRSLPATLSAPPPHAWWPPEWANAHIYRRLLEERGVPLVTPEGVEDWGSITMFCGWKPPLGLLEQVREGLIAAGAGMGGVACYHAES